MRIIFSFIIFFLLNSLSTHGQEVKKRIYKTQKIGIKDKAITIDGKINEPVWESVKWEDHFVQYEPYEGAEPGQQTEFKILYDDNNIYVAIRALDSSPDSINTRLTRRDEMDGDVVGIQLDSYYDKLTAFSFLVNAGGVKTDMMMTNDGENEDLNWNPIWFVKTKVINEGWVAEMKIPLSQLRFDKATDLIWGVQIARSIYRKQELSLWQPTPKDASGWVHQFGLLEGISGIKPKRQIELAPYGVASLDTYKKEEGNPFKDGKDYKLNGGIDGKIGITNNMILDFTVNPDFGQVEADPSQLNLTAFETFFEEKRPFFIEGKNTLSFPVSGIDGGDMGAENLFYSRRIGRRPHGYPSVNEGEYAKIPNFTSILGAAKITGKTKNGLSYGILESVTAEEKAEIDFNGKSRFETVEPLTNYLVSRVQKDFNKGKTILGGMLTSTNRRVNDTSLNDLHKSAITGGIDFTTTWKEKNYYFTLNTMFSQVRGSEEALIRTQRSSARYYQRPDAKHLTLDSTRTSLFGHAGSLSAGKQGGGHFNFGGILTWKSPGFEINDIGFVRSTDEIVEVLYAGYRIWDPFSIFRSMNFNLAQWHAWDFGGVNLMTGGNFNFNTQFKNYYRFGTGLNLSSQRLSNSTLRGGPMFKSPGSESTWIFVSSDDRKKLVYEVSGRFSRENEQSSKSQHYRFELSYRPINTLRFSLEPSLSLSKQELQYISTTSYQSDPRYLFGTIDQKLISLDFRISLNLTPDLSIQYWGQPFIAAGDYSSFKRITSPQADNFVDRFHVFDNNEIKYDENSGNYLIDENKDGNTDYGFGNPDFNIKEFLSNMVLRWEYRPGSTLYAVWSQSREGIDPDGRFIVNEDIQNLFRISPHNVFMIKFSYRFSL